jgi:hypothetical protein
MRKKEHINPPSKDEKSLQKNVSPRDEFNNAGAMDLEAEELIGSVRKLSERLGDIYKIDNTEVKVDKASQLLSSKLNIKKTHVIKAYEDDKERMIKASFNYNNAEQKIGSSIGTGLVSGIFAFGSTLFTLIAYTQFDNFSPIGLSLSIMTAASSVVAFNKVSKGIKEQQAITTDVRDRLKNRLEFVQSKQLPSPKKN